MSTNGNGHHLERVPPGAPDPEEPWLQLEGEPDKQYQAFLQFMNQGRGRSIAVTYRLVSGRQADDVTVEAPGYYREWARQFAWVMRARAWDEKVERTRREAELAAVQKEVEDRRKARLGAFRGALGAGQVILSKANLSKLDERPARNLLSHAARLIEVGARGERLEMGEPDSVQQQILTGAGGGAVEVQATGNFQVDAQTLAVQLSATFGALPPDERTARLNDLETFLQLGKSLGQLLIPGGVEPDPD